MKRTGIFALVIFKTTKVSFQGHAHPLYIHFANLLILGSYMNQQPWGVYTRQLIFRIPKFKKCLIIWLS